MSIDQLLWGKYCQKKKILHNVLHTNYATKLQAIIWSLLVVASLFIYLIIVQREFSEWFGHWILQAVIIIRSHVAQLEPHPSQSSPTHGRIERTGTWVISAGKRAAVNIFTGLIRALTNKNVPKYYLTVVSCSDLKLFKGYWVIL